jgi:hypothetical protein
MNQTKMRTILLLTIAALALLFAGCKGESPTAPPPISGPGSQPTGGGTPPPSGATITLTSSVPSTVVNGTIVISAAVSVNNAAAPNGTAVEFVSNNTSATFTDSNDVKVIKTTTSGVATATITSTDPGAVTVTATVNNVAKSIQVTFNPAPVPPGPPPSTAPTVTGATPNIGKPAGGDVVVISGTNFVSPVRVLFDLGGGNVKEASVQSVTSTSITVLTPPIDLGTGQTAAASIIVITQAGSANELRATRAGAFTYQLAVLTPTIRFLSPTSGPIDGGTRISIFGDGFQSPVQVFFGAAQAQVISVLFGEIQVSSPTARDTAPNGSGAVTGPVDVKVVNGLAGQTKAATLTGGFRYIAKVQVTALAPNEGPFTGGTRFHIDGTGFEGPVSVTLAGVAAQIINVNSTEITGISSAAALTSCSDSPGPSIITNINNGDQATGPNWTYRIIKPTIINIASPVNLGAATNITVAGAVGPSKITVGGAGVNINSALTNPDGSVTFNVQIPPTLKLDTVSCGGGVNAPTTTPFDVVFTSLQTTCTDTSPKGLAVNPLPVPALAVSPPTGFTAMIAPITPGNPGSPGPPVVPPTAPSVKPSAAQIVLLVSTGPSSQPLIIQSTSTADAGGAGCARFSIGLPPNGTNLQQCDSAPVVAQYNGSTIPGTDQCRITIVTNAGTKTFNLIGTSQ